MQVVVSLEYKQVLIQGKYSNAGSSVGTVQTGFDTGKIQQYR